MSADVLWLKAKILYFRGCVSRKMTLWTFKSAYSKQSMSWTDYISLSPVQLRLKANQRSNQVKHRMFAWSALHVRPGHSQALWQHAETTFDFDELLQKNWPQQAQPENVIALTSHRDKWRAGSEFDHPSSWHKQFETYAFTKRNWSAYQFIFDFLMMWMNSFFVLAEFLIIWAHFL